MSTEMGADQAVDTAQSPVERELLTKIEGHATQVDVAVSYARALRSDVDWPRVNRAITERWSKSGLLEIKRLAWALAAASSQPPPPKEGS